MATLFECWRGRARDETFTLYQPDGVTPANLAVTDIVRLKVSRGDGELYVDLSSIEASPNKSQLTFTAGQNTVACRIGQEETAGWPTGAYDYELSVVDGTDSIQADAIKSIQEGVFFLHPTPGGEIGDALESSESASSQSPPI